MYMIIKQVKVLMACACGRVEAVVEGHQQRLGEVEETHAGGVQDGTAVLAGVKRVVEHVETNIDLDDAAQQGGQGGGADLPVGGVGHDDDIGGEPVPVGAQEALEGGAADLLLALDEDRHRAGQLAVGQGRQGAQGVGVGDDAGLVVGGTAPVEPLTAALGGEGISLVPTGRVADGLDVVVGVEQDVRAALGSLLVGQDGRPAGGIARWDSPCRPDSNDIPWISPRDSPHC